MCQEELRQGCSWWQTCIDINRQYTSTSLGSTKCIEDLPDDVLVEIFSYLSFDDLVHSVQYVLARWRDVAQDDYLWRKLQYNPARKVPDEEILKTVKQAPKLQTLLIYYRPLNSLVLDSVLKNCPELKKAWFSVRQILSTKSLECLAHNCTKLEHLYIPEISYNEVTAQIIGQCQNLNTLHFYGFGDPQQPVSLKPIADGCPALRHVDLRYQFCRNEELEYLLQKKQHQLQSLELRWSADETNCAIPLLKVCKMLTKLIVQYRDIDNVFHESFDNVDILAGFEALRCLKSVTSLTLSYLRSADINNLIGLFSDGGMSQLKELSLDHYHCYEDKLAETIYNNCPHLKVLSFESLLHVTERSFENLHTLKELENITLMSCWEITDSCLNHIVKCERLKYVNLYACSHLSEQSMKQLTDLNKLTILKLDYCNIKGLPFSIIPTHLTNLTLLSVDFCRGVDLDALNALKTEMPQLTVHNVTDKYHRGEEERRFTCCGLM